MRYTVVALLLAVTAGGAMAAEVLSAADASVLLKKIATASRKQSYSGSYLHQHGAELATFRVAHVSDAEGELEKREPLEGAARELIRNNGQVSCYLPEPPANPAEVKRHALMKQFPALLNDDSVESSGYYSVKHLPNERVAGVDCQVLLLDPKDNLRYGHKLWFDASTGLLLKAATLNARREIVEQFAFTEVSVGSIERKNLKPRFAHRVDIFTPDKNRPDNARPRFDSGWEVRTIPAGYKVVRESKVAVGNNLTRVSHLWLSDGWGAVSVFIEAAQPAAAEPGQTKAPAVDSVRGPASPAGVLVSQGVVNVVSRNSPEASVVVMGDVPETVVTTIAASVAPRPQKTAASQ